MKQSTIKPFIRNLFLLPALIACFGLTPAGWVTAQTFTVLHTFTGYDGAYPRGGLILSGKTLYGTASGGGGSARGAVFAVNTDGTGFTNLHGFTESEGAEPLADLVLSGNMLYGTSSSLYNYGVNQNGTVFKLNTNGTGFTTLHSFTATPEPFPNVNSDGARPYSGLIVSGNTLFGTAEMGGSFGKGTVFKMNTNGTGFTTLHSFKGLISDEDTGGHSPRTTLILSGNTLYGTAWAGGGPDNGTVFRIKTDGTGFTNLHSFYGLGGAHPNGLILSSNTLYGTTGYGGSADNGTVFKINTNGTGFAVLYSFTAFPFGLSTNSDGARPQGGLILSGNTLYGTANEGGPNAVGTVFALNTDGTGFTPLYAFTINNGSNSDGAYPWAELLLSGNTLYGTALGGGSLSYGTVFSLSFAPQLAITRSAANVILAWPTNFAGFDYSGFILQSTTNLFPTAWSPVAQSAVTNAGQISVTIPTGVGCRFFRLKSQ